MKRGLFTKNADILLLIDAMENLQADEETRPLTQPPRRVVQAYAANNDGSR